MELTRISGVGGDEQDIGSDFASTLGTGGVLGTKFTWPDYGPKLKNVYLNEGKEPTGRNGSICTIRRCYRRAISLTCTFTATIRRKRMPSKKTAACSTPFMHLLKRPSLEAKK